MRLLTPSSETNVVSCSKIASVFRRFSSNNGFTIFGEVQAILPTWRIVQSVELGFGKELEEAPNVGHIC